MPIRRSYSGNAPPTTLTSGVSDSALSIPVASVTGYPAGGVAGPFYIVIDRGLATEEKILIDDISGLSFVVNAAGRGVDGTVAASHGTGAVIEHIITKTDIDEANAHTSDTTTDVHTQYVLESYLSANYSTTTDTQTAIDSTVDNEVIHYKGHTFTIGGEVFVPSGDVDYVVPFFVPVYAGTYVKLVRARYRINSGTSATVKLQKNGVDITGFTGISVTTTAATTNPADVSLADDDLIALVVTAVSGNPKNLTFTLVLEHG